MGFGWPSGKVPETTNASSISTGDEYIPKRRPQAPLPIKSMCRRQRFSACLVVPALLALTGCGGGGQQSTGGAPPVQLPSPTPAPTPAPTPTPTPPPASGFALSADIRYGDGPTVAGTIPLLLDLYRPNQNCSSPRPTVIYVHGGGFTSGSRKGAQVETMATELAQFGINLVSIQYRLEGNAPAISAEFAAFESDYQRLAVGQPAARVRAFVAAVEDAVRAMRWVQANANQYCMDSSRIGLWGSSAGAVTVLHVAYSLDPYAIAYPRPAVVVDYWGLLFRDTDLGAGEPPLFVLHGTADTVVPFAEATELTDRARQVGVPYSFYTIAGGGHDFNGSGFFQRTIDGQSIARRTAIFMDAHLGPGGVPVYETRTIP